MGHFERKIISFEVTVTEIFEQNKHKLSETFSGAKKTEYLICNSVHDRNIMVPYRNL